MKRIIKDYAPPSDQILVGDALRGWPANGKLIAVVYEGAVSILVDGAHNKSFNTDGWRCAGLWTLCSDNYGRWSTQSATPLEVLQRAGGSEMYLFDTLAEFAQAVLDNGWR